MQTAASTAPAHSRFEPWLDSNLIQYMENRGLDWARPVYHIGKSISFPEAKLIEGMRREIPQKSVHPTKNLCDLGRYAMFIQTLRSDAGMPMPEGGPCQGAVTMVIKTFRSYGLNVNATVEQLQRLMGWDGIGRVSVSPSDRMAWSYAVEAISKLDTEVVDVASFDASMGELLEFGRELEKLGPWGKEKSEEMFERASQLFIGVCIPSEAVIELIEDELNEVMQAVALSRPDDSFEKIAMDLGIDVKAYSLMSMTLDEVPPRLGH